MNEVQREQLKQLPQVQRLLESDRTAALTRRYSRDSVVDMLRQCLDELRRDITAGHLNGFSFSEDSFFDRVEGALKQDRAMSLRRVINATGIVLHTNLGRAPLADQAIQAIADVARGYSNLELDLKSGKRGSRYRHIEEILCSLTASEAVMVVNNNAAAVMLVLNSMAMDSEVIVSRGELVEIGGSFRIPDVITRSGGRLVEVGSTNRTRIADYENAITDNTRALLKVHPSNYKIMGFTEEASREELVQLGRTHNLVVIEDLGSGTLVDLGEYGLPHETTVQEVLKSGVDIVTFSGDKLLGGPQAGIIAGRRDAIETMKANPLLRGLRIDKLSLAALEATLRLYLDTDTLPHTLPLLAMLTADAETLQHRASVLHAKLAAIPSIHAEIEAATGYVGGGSLPHEERPSRRVTLRADTRSAHELAEALRMNEPPILARTVDDCVALDLRTLSETELDEIAEAVRRIVS